ncbi:MAG: PIG-L deacetylase family protein [Alphaproteobacteria bacterium]
MKKLYRHLSYYFLTKKAFRFLLDDWSPAFEDLKISADIISTLRFSKQIKTLEVEAPTGGDLLIIAPHPDDEMIGPGGTILKAVKSGAKVSILYLTSGAKHEEKAREEECVKIADAIGANIIGFLRRKPKHMKCDDALVDIVADAINKHGKNGVFIPFLFDDHPDHKIVSDILYKAYLDKKISGKMSVWAYQVYTSLLPNIVVDITDVMPEKKEMIDIYQSQFYCREWSHYTAGLNAYNCRYLKQRNDEAYAEIFLQLPMHAYAELCEKTYNK